MVKTVRATQLELDTAVQALRDGEVVAFPTETVYGLGADATNGAAVRRLYAVKGRPPGHPVIAHLGRDADLDQWAIDVSDTARKLTAACWPGPLTVIVHEAEPDQPGDTAPPADVGRSVAADVAEAANAAATSIR